MGEEKEEVGRGGGATKWVGEKDPELLYTISYHQLVLHKGSFQQLHMRNS